MLSEYNNANILRTSTLCYAIIANHWHLFVLDCMLGVFIMFTFLFTRLMRWNTLGFNSMVEQRNNA